MAFMLQTLKHYFGACQALLFYKAGKALENPGMPDNSALAALIRAAIESGPCSKQEIADHFNISVQAVDGWLNTGRIHKNKLAGLARLTRRPLSYFLGGDDGNSYPTQSLRLDPHTLTRTYRTIVAVLDEDGRAFDMARHARAFAIVYERGGVLTAGEIKDLRKMLLPGGLQGADDGIGMAQGSGKGAGTKRGRKTDG